MTSPDEALRLAQFIVKDALGTTDVERTLASALRESRSEVERLRGEWIALANSFGIDAPPKTSTAQIATHARYLQEERARLLFESVTLKQQLTAASALAAQRGEELAQVQRSLHSVREKWSAMKSRYERAGSDHHLKMPGDWPVDVVMTMDELRSLAAMKESAK